MKNTWNFKDILDLFYLNYQDTPGNIKETEALHQRDRHIFLTSQGATEDVCPSQQELLSIWVSRRRKEQSGDAQTTPPGNKVKDAFTLFFLTLLAAGGLTGTALGLSYFVYTGKTPLNVFLFLTLFILPQLLFTLIAVASTFAPVQRRMRLKWLQNLFVRFYALLHERKVPEPGPSGNLGFIEKLAREKSPLLCWPLFKGSQLFSLGLNLGLLATTATKIVTTDLAFGWQSTLQFSEEKLYSLVQVIALPWSWMLPANYSYPSLLEIEGSRIILKDTIYELSTNDLTSWWPFLLLCLLFYGLLPRILLLLSGFAMERLSYKNMLHDSRFNSICQRMLTPLLTTQAPPQPPSPVKAEIFSEASKEAKTPLQESLKETLVLIADDVFDNYPMEVLRKLLLPWRCNPLKRLRIFTNHNTDNDILRMLPQEDWNKLHSLVIFLEVWMAPIEEHLHFLRQAGTSIDENTFYGMYCLGRPTSPTISSPPRQKDIDIWQKNLGGTANRPVPLMPTDPKPKQHQVMQ